MKSFFLPVTQSFVLAVTTFLPILADVQPAAITLAILAPTADPQAAVQTASVEIAGTAASSTGLPIAVTWIVNQKYGGRTEASPRWSTGFVNLAGGPNLVEVTASDGVSAPVTRQVVLNVEAPLQPAPDKESLHFKLGRYQGRLVQYRIVNGRAIFEGDIDLGNPAALDPQLTPPPATKAAVTERPIPESLGVALQSSLWSKVGGVAQVPYVISADTTTGVAAAITAFNNTFGGIIQFVPYSSQINYVNFSFDTSSPYGVCESAVGMAGGEQTVGGSVYCATPTVLHEMGHVVGLWHEMSRSDRNNYVVVNTANIDRPYQPNFDPVTYNALNIGFYDYSSIMHYSAFGFSVNGFPTLESTPVAGIQLSNTTGYSSGDIDGIKRLYGAAPTQVTIDTNPSGLQVTVDGATVTTPYLSSGWALGSQHTLTIPASVEEDASGNWYTFALWNNLTTTATSQTITLVAGNAELTQPATSPANTYYVANFVPLWPFSADANSIDGMGTGTIVTSPNPATYAPAPGTYYLNRQQVTMTATPGTGSQFYGWGDSNYPLGDNPHTFLAGFAENPLYGNFVSTNVGLTSFQTTIPGLYYPPASVTIDSNGLFVPLTFAAGIDSGWTAGSSHSAVAITPLSPVTTNVEYNFLQWADQTSSSATHPPITQIASGRQTFTAQYDNGSFRGIVYSSPACGGSVNGAATVNGALDEMFAGGSSQTFTAAANSPLVFAGWSQDLASFGTTAAATTTISAELYATANFNVVSTPLTITGFSPLTAEAGNANGFTLTINGTGFTSNTLVFWNSSYIASPFVSPTELQISLSAADIATAGGQIVTVENIATVSGASCYVFQDATYNLTSSSPVAVPNVVGLTQSAATSSITAAGLGVGPVTMASSATVPSGDVISENPSAGTLVNPGSSVNLVVSTGSSTISVPNVVGLTQAAASSAITGAGLVVGTVTTAFSNTVASGNVISQNPVANTHVLSGSAVNLVVSSGPAQKVAPTAFSVTPSTGSGPSQTFTFKFSSVNGYAYLNTLYMAINTSVGSGNSCRIEYLPATNQLYLYPNAGASGTLLGPLTPGAAGTVGNSQCTLNAATSSTMPSGNVLSVSLAISFQPTFIGLKNIYGYALDDGNLNSGWATLGNWSPVLLQAVAPTVTSVSPAIGAGISQTFSFKFSSVNGYAYLSTVFAVISTGVGSGNSCRVEYLPATNQLYLYPDVGASGTLLGPMTPGATGTLSNSQCTLNVGGTTAGGSGNTVTLNAAITFQPTFAGIKNIYGYDEDLADRNSGWVTLGHWNTAAVQAVAPTANSVTPDSGMGNSQTFTFAFSSVNSYLYLSTFYAVINTGVGSGNSCRVEYLPASNQLYLYPDAGASGTLLGPMTPGVTGTLSNSQCTLNVGETSAAGAGNTITLKVALTFQPAFAGLKNIYGYAEDLGDRISGWVTLGTWNTAP